MKLRDRAEARFVAWGIMNPKICSLANQPKNGG
jgi:hypothetical protein